MLFSVIVPVYNAELTLDECVGSVLGAESRNFELILVNDGSRDNSAAMCDAFAARDSRVAVIHQENQGLACARNAGIQAAYGDFLVHLDCDDFFKGGWFETIASEIKSCPDADVFVWGIYLWQNGDLFADNVSFPVDKTGTLAGKIAFDILFCSRLGTLWQTFRYVVRRTSLLQLKMFYSPGVLHEDVDHNPFLVLKLGSVHFCRDRYYAYRQGRQGSITSGQTVARCRDMITIATRWTDRLPATGLSVNTQQRFKAVLARLLWDVVATIPRFQKRDRITLFSDMSTQVCLLEESRDPPLASQGKRVLLSVVGVKGASWVLWWIRRWRQHGA